MRPTLFLIALFTVASAAFVPETRDLHDFPDCAIPCLHSTDHDHCAPKDLKCLCHSKKFTDDSRACFEKGAAAPMFRRLILPRRRPAIPGAEMDTATAMVIRRRREKVLGFDSILTGLHKLRLIA